MAPYELESLLSRIDEAEPALLERVRTLLARFEAENPLGLGDAVRTEAGDIDVGEFVGDALSLDPGLDEGLNLADLLGLDPGDGLTLDPGDGLTLDPGDGLTLGDGDLAAALFGEAGEIDLTGSIMGAIGVKLPVADAVRMELGGEVPIAEAVRASAGDVDVADAIMIIVGERQLPIANAVRAEAGTIDIVDAVFATLGLVDEKLPLAAAIAAEAGTMDDARQVMALLGVVDGLPIAAAIRAEAGDPDIADVVMLGIDPSWISALLDHELSPAARNAAVALLAKRPGSGREMTALADVGRELRAAVVMEVGEIPDLWDGIARGIGIAEPEVVEGWDAAAFVQAVRGEAGDVNVVADVMKRITRSSVGVAAETPVAANRGFTWGAVALAAVALFAVVVGQTMFANVEPQRAELSASLDFANAAEITVDDLSYSATSNVQVIQAEGDDGALIIWVDEETL